MGVSPIICTWSLVVFSVMVIAMIQRTGGNVQDPFERSNLVILSCMRRILLANLPLPHLEHVIVPLLFSFSPSLLLSFSPPLLLSAFDAIWRAKHDGR